MANVFAGMLPPKCLCSGGNLPGKRAKASPQGSSLSLKFVEKSDVSGEIRPEQKPKKMRRPGLFWQFRQFDFRL
jgi:hypothetical protein